MAAVAVIIPTYNNLPELRQCLKALSQQTYTDFVAYVCVDGSTDGTLEYLSSQPYEFVKVLTHPDGRNHGRNAARNLALPYLHQHRWVAFLDSDSIPLPNWLEAFCAA
jgi:glycosyltransferase involved in cell wall biosynthesis